MVNEPEIRNVPFQFRKCYFSDEKHLEIYPSYGYHACLTQCNFDKIRKICGCSLHFFPLGMYCIYYTYNSDYDSFSIPGQTQMCLR